MYQPQPQFGGAFPPPRQQKGCWGRNWKWLVPVGCLGLIFLVLGTLVFPDGRLRPGSAAVLAALDIIEQEPERREQLWRNATHLRAGLQELGFNTGRSATPIIPVILGEDTLTFRFWRALFDRGIFTNAAVRQAVAPGCSLLRTSVIATHTSAHIDRVLEAFEEVGRALGVIP